MLLEGVGSYWQYQYRTLFATGLALHGFNPSELLLWSEVYNVGKSLLIAWPEQANSICIW